MEQVGLPAKLAGEGLAPLQATSLLTGDAHSVTSVCYVLGVEAPPATLLIPQTSDHAQS